MLVFIDGIKGIGLIDLIDGLHGFLLGFLFLLLILLMGVDPRDKESISIVFDVLHLGRWPLAVYPIFLKNLEVADLHLEIWRGLIDVTSAHISL